MTTERPETFDMDPRLRVKKQVIKMGQDIFYTSNLLRMRVTCEDRGVRMEEVGGVKMASGMVTTNGKLVNFHPEYVRRVSDERIAYHLKKAVLQVALKHHLVREKYPDMDDRVISLASSLSINHILMHDEGIPKDAPIAGTPGSFFEYLQEGRPMEHYVEAIKDMQEKQQQEQQQQQQKSMSGSGAGSSGSGEGEGESSDDEGHGEDDPVSDDNDSGSDRGDSGGDSESSGDSDEHSDSDEGDGTDDDHDSDSGDSGEESEDEDGSDDGDDSEDSEESSEDSDDESELNPEESVDWDNLPKEFDTGDVEQHPDATPKNTESLSSDVDHQVAGAIAACANGQGDVPSELKEMYEHMLAPSKLDYKSMLRRFCNTFNNTGFTYQKPNRRHAWRSDVILPARKSRGLNHIVFAVDTSGSMQAETINRALDELNSIVKTWPSARITMIECSTEITNEESVDKYSVANLKKGHEWTGRGGTDLRPPFKRAEELSDVKCIIYLTDLMGPKPDKREVKTPTLWLVEDQGGNYGLNSDYIRKHYYPDFGIVVPMSK